MGRRESQQLWIRRSLHGDVEWLEDFRPPNPTSSREHWRESKIGCLLFMESATHNTNPCPLIPNSFAHASVVQEIAQIAENEVLFAEQTSDTLELTKPKDIENTYKAPKLVSREVIATGKTSEDFGWQLEARAWQPWLRCVRFERDLLRTRPFRNSRDLTTKSVAC